MDINGGQLTQTANNPYFVGATSTGPLLAGNVVHNDPSNNLANLGGGIGLANCGYTQMVQFQNVSQAATSTNLNIVLPAQSMIVTIQLFITTVWSGASTNVQIKDTLGNVYTAVGGAGTIGRLVLAPGANQGHTQLFENIGTADAQLAFVNTNTGNGLGVLQVIYLQGSNVTQTT